MRKPLTTFTAFPGRHAPATHAPATHAPARPQAPALPPVSCAPAQESRPAVVPVPVPEPVVPVLAPEPVEAPGAVPAPAGQEDTVPEPAREAAPKRALVSRPLRLRPAVEGMLRDLAAARPGLSLNELISMLIAEEWRRAFQPDRYPAEAAGYHPDTRQIPDSDRAVARSARTLRLRPELDQRLGELAAHYGGLDRNSAVSLILTSGWQRICGRGA